MKYQFCATIYPDIWCDWHPVPFWKINVLVTKDSSVSEGIWNIKRIQPLVFGLKREIKKINYANSK